ncbi:MAG: universal stress protein [Thermodesulfobacteriota bacterium]
MKNLLIATDLSSRSDRALHRAINLALEKNYNLHVIHVVDEDLPDAVASTIKKEAEETIPEQIKSFKNRMKIKVTIKVIIGKHYEAILSESEKINAKAIILGTPKKATLKDFFIGSTAERVVRNSNVPVIVVKKASMKKYKRAVVAIDFSVYSRRCLDFALDIFANEEIYLVHCYHIPYKLLIEPSHMTYKDKRDQKKGFLNMVNQEMTHFLKPIQKDTRNINIIIKEGPAIDCLNNEIRRLKADLLILGTHGRTGMSRALIGSVANNMLTTSKCDIAIIKAW